MIIHIDPTIFMVVFATAFVLRYAWLWRNVRVLRREKRNFRKPRASDVVRRLVVDWAILTIAAAVATWFLNTTPLVCYVLIFTFLLGLGVQHFVDA